MVNMITKKKTIKKQEVKKSPQPKKEYKTEVIKPKKELISDPDKFMSICLSREQIYKIKMKMKDDPIAEYFERVLA
jgi:hypothetical protein